MPASRDLPFTSALVSLLDASADAAFTLDAAGYITYANPAAARMVRLKPSDLIGRSLEQDFPHAFSATWLAESRRARTDGKPHEYEAFNPPTGRWVRVLIVPTTEGLAVQIRDVTAQVHATALQRVTAALVDARTTTDVTSVLVEQAARATGAASAAFATLTTDGNHLEPYVHDAPPNRPRERVPVTLDLPECRVARTGASVYATGDTYASERGHLAGRHSEATRSLAALPITLEGRTWGVLTLCFHEARLFGPQERAFLEALARQGAQALDRTETAARLREQAEIVTTLNHTQQAVSAELSLDALVQIVTDAGVNLTGAAFGAFFYTVKNDQGEAYTLYTLSGVPREAFSRFPMPRNTKVFAPTFAGEGVMRVHDITRDARYAQNPPYHGMPEGHLPVRSYLAVPVVSRSGEALGGLFFGHPDAGVFTERAEQLALGLAAQTAVAVDNARLYQQLQDSHAQLERHVEERTRQIEAQAVALDAFAAFTEAVGTETDTRVLARQAIATLRTRFPDDSVAYYERDGDLWKLKEWTSDLSDDIVAVARAGFPSDTPIVARALQLRQPVFVDGWDATRERVEHSDVYGAIGLYPLMLDGDVVALLAVGHQQSTRWTPREQALVNAVGRGLTLALERAQQTSRLETQRDALEARTRALEAFAVLSRDLTVQVDAIALVRRAQEILMSLLSDGYALYWQPEGTSWRNRSLVGSLGNTELQSVVEAGLPRGSSPTLDVPWETRRAHYQDVYARGADTDANIVQHVNAVAMLPILVRGEPHGMIGVGLFSQRHWTTTDKAVLESVARSLGLALEGSENARDLKKRTQELERSNAELERFAYVASHDLQEPLRTIASFTELLNRRYGESLDETGRKYLGLVTRGAERMKVLIDDLLVFSRLNAVQEPLTPVSAAASLQDALTRLEGLVNFSGARVTHDPLPLVLGNALELTQLFQNLIGNAIKFRRADVTPQVHVTAEREGEAWHFRVQDNGIGFDERYAERVFQIFQRLHLREQYEGTGMGLAIVRKIVERHGGRVWAESTPGEGSTFHFTLQSAGAPKRNAGGDA